MAPCRIGDSESANLTGKGGLRYHALDLLTSIGSDGHRPKFRRAHASGYQNMTGLVVSENFLFWHIRMQASEYEQLARLVKHRREDTNATILLACSLGLVIATTISLSRLACKGHRPHWTAAFSRRLFQLLSFCTVRINTCSCGIVRNDNEASSEEREKAQGSDSEVVNENPLSTEVPTFADQWNNFRNKSSRCLIRIRNAVFHRNKGYPLPIRLYCVPDIVIGACIMAIMSTLSLLTFTPKYFGVCLSRAFSSIAAEQVVGVDALIIILWTVTDRGVPIIEKRLMQWAMVLRLVLQLITPAFRPAALIPYNDSLHPGEYFCLRVSLPQFGIVQVSYDVGLGLYALIRHLYMFSRQPEIGWRKYIWNWQIGQCLAALFWFSSSIPEAIGVCTRQYWHALHATASALLVCESSCPEERKFSNWRPWGLTALLD